MMRMSRLFGETLRESPSEAKLKGHEYLLRGAYLRSLPDGSTAHLSLGQKIIANIITLFRQTLVSLNGQEILIIPSTTVGGTGSIPTPLRQLLILAQREIRSYRQLPQRLFQFQTRPSGTKAAVSNPMRMKTTTTLDCVFLDSDGVNSEESHRSLLKLLEEMLERITLPTSLTQSGIKVNGQSILYPFPEGEQVALECQSCSYLEVIEAASLKKIPAQGIAPKPLEKVPTPGAHTIAELATFLNIPQSETAKAVFSMAAFPQQDQPAEKLVFSILRGDMELNEAKLSRTLGAQSIRPATDAEISSVGAVPGFASPIGIEGALVVVDELIPHSPNLVAGANEEDYHYLNVNYGRDYQADLIADVVQAGEGDPCPNCGDQLHPVSGVVLAQLIRIAPEISEDFNLTYLDPKGFQQPVRITTLSLDLHNLLAAIAQEHHDEFGLLIPALISPLKVHLIRLKGDEGQADVIYQRLKENECTVLYDDRSDQPGVKFNDADLIGLPIRITLGKRSLAGGGAEVKLRDQEEKVIVPLEGLVEYVKSTYENLS